MWRYVARRLLWLVAVLLIITAITYGIFFVMSPVDPAVLFAGKQPTPQVIAEIKREFGLNKPVWQQYGLFVQHVFVGDQYGWPGLGFSFVTRASVKSQLGSRLVVTATLAFGAAFVWLILYDLAQVTIPSDNVDDAYLRRPQRWDVRVIRDFMLFIGPISSIFDFLTFYILLAYFHATERLFHTGWFVESLATQTLVLFVIRTMGNPFRSRPSRSLTLTTLLIVAVGIILPLTPIASLLGFTTLPASYFAFLIPATITYLALVDVAKRRLARRLGL